MVNPGCQLSQGIGRNWTRHGITSRRRTGLELDSFEGLDPQPYLGPVSARLYFWRITEKLPRGSLVMFSELQDPLEMRTMFPFCPTKWEDLMEHVCLARVDREKRHDILLQIMRIMVDICRHRAGIVDNNPDTTGVRLGRNGWVSWNDVLKDTKWYSQVPVNDEFLASLWFCQRKGLALSPGVEFLLLAKCPGMILWGRTRNGQRLL